MKLDAAAARKKARTAFDNAKYRCKNETAYASVKFLYCSFGQFVEDVGLPTCADESLDRINVNGHYEAGNCRWTNKFVQAANKKGAPKASVLTLSQLEAKYKAPLGSARIIRAEAWKRTIEAANDLGWAASDLDFFAANSTLDPRTQFSFPIGIGYCVNQPCVFALPSLTVPEPLVRIRGGPFRSRIGVDAYKEAQLNKAYARRGLIAGLSRVQATYNVHESDRARVAHAIKNRLVGCAFCAQPHKNAWAQGAIETRFLALASRLISVGKEASLYPLLELVSLLKQMKSSEWDDADAPAFRDNMFVPDLQVDLGESFDVASYDLGFVRNLLAWRSEHELTTFVGIQNPMKLPEGMRSLIFSRYDIFEWPQVPVILPSVEDASVAEDAEEF